ncbi:MAG: PKD domain-containing protein [Gammaproteobacteria bacterium]|nr:MAG: PKD domain-containing protein [Gammaproteobacteria bacterium]
MVAGELTEPGEEPLMHARRFALLTFVSFAFAGVAVAKDAGNATDAINPHSPRYGHPYRHGVHPTRETHGKMKAWEAANRGVVRPADAEHKERGSVGATEPAIVAAATGPETLSFGGGVDSIGVTSGAPKVYLVFWGTQWGTEGTNSNGYATFTGDPRNAAPYIQAWIKGLGTNGELWSGVMTQYCDGSQVAVGATSCPSGAPHVGYPSGALAGIWYDNSAASPSQASGKQLAAEAVKAAGHFGNTTPASNRYAQYVILSPTGTHPDGFNTPGGGFCAWHDYNGDTTLSGGGAAPSPYGDIAFTNMPYVADLGASCGANFVSNSLDGYSIVGGHEYAETITDQNPAGGWVNNTGSSFTGQENGDECAWISSGQGAAALVAFSTGSFAMQSTWSNDTNRCDLSHPIVSGSSGGGTPTANFTYSASALTVSFTDTSTDSGGTIGSHAWTFGDGGTSSAPNPTHTYAAGGTYSVTETVTDSGNGSTSSKTSAVTVSGSGGTPTANFTYSASGLTVNFTDTSTDSGGSIGMHSWNFDDGNTSTAANPSHTYASAGTYSVSETVYDSVNNRSSTKTLSITVTASTSSQLILNGGFETGSAAPWALTAGVLCSNSGCPGETAHSGSWFAWLDGYGFTHTDTATQTVSIPAGKTTATLAFYLHIDTQEVGSIAYDTLRVQVLNSSGTVLATLATYSNVNAASGYSLHSLNMNAYIGQTVQIRFYGHEDSSLATSFVIDDVTLTVQ